jgi:predicted nucleic acid-binding protein
VRLATHPQAGATMRELLIDTDVLIWHLRGYPKAAAALDKAGSFAISSVSYMELLQGMRGKAELLAVKKMLQQRNAVMLEVTATSSQRAVTLMEGLTSANGLGMADALIAATALENGLAILTGNTKHFRTIPDLQVVPFKP